MTKIHKLSILALALCAILSAAAVGQPPAAGVKEPVKKDEPSVVKAFEFKTANPVEVQQLLTRHLGAAGPNKGGPAKPAVLVAVDPKTKTIFVRGAAADVETAGKIIAQLDGGATDGPLHVIHLQTTSVDEVMRVLNSLELGAGVYPFPASRALIVAHGSANADQIKAIIEKLDGPVKPAPKGGKTEPAAKGKN